MADNFYKAIIKKDLRTVFSDKLIYLPFILVPVIFCVILPIGAFIGSAFGNSANGLNSIPLPGIDPSYNAGDKVLAVALGMLFPSLFLLIPIMSGSIVAATGFIGEKEKKTIESLLYTRISIEQLFKAKILSAFVPSFLLTLASFILFFVISMAGLSIVGSHYVFPFMKWFVLIFWLSPVITLLAIFIMVLTSAKAKSFQEAQQRVVFIILPVVLIILGQVSGLFYLDTLVIFIAGLFILGINYFMLKLAVKSYTAEKLVM